MSKPSRKINGAPVVAAPVVSDDRRSKQARNIGSIGYARVHAVKWWISASFRVAMFLTPPSVRVEVAEGIILWIQRSIARSNG